MNRVEQMKKIQNEALELFAKKNIDYGDAFAKYGIIGVLHLWTFKTPNFKHMPIIHHPEYIHLMY
jgi:hypothetical protein